MLTIEWRSAQTKANRSVFVLPSRCRWLQMTTQHPSLQWRALTTNRFQLVEVNTVLLRIQINNIRQQKILFITIQSKSNIKTSWAEVNLAQELYNTHFCDPDTKVALKIFKSIENRFGKVDRYAGILILWQQYLFYHISTSVLGQQFISCPWICLPLQSGLKRKC